MTGPRCNFIVSKSFDATATTVATSTPSIQRGGVGSHLREVRRGDAAEAELEAAGLGEVALRGQADRLAGRGDQPVPVEHLSPAVRHGGRVFRFHHDFKSQREWKNEKPREAHDGNVTVDAVDLLRFSTPAAAMLDSDPTTNYGGVTPRK